VLLHQGTRKLIKKTKPFLSMWKSFNLLGSDTYNNFACRKYVKKKIKK